MNRNHIEDRDQELVNKFRTVVKGKEEGKKRKKARLIWLSAVILTCCAALVLIVLRPSTSRRGATPATAAKTGIRLTEVTYSAIKGKKVDTAENTVSRPAVKAVKPPAPGHEKPLPETHETLGVKAPVAKAPAEPIKTAPKKLPAKVAAPAEPREKEAKSVRIAKIVSCKGISNKNFVSPKDVFSMSMDKKPVIWMEVYSPKKELPYTLKHVYYVNGKKYFAVPLKIRYPRMRTWSRITLRHDFQVGKWRVDVVDGKGNILATKRFTVTP
ncbi:MAG: DUF2914 domain-containing protein [Deltaproteobacteria bacterium]|nr:DUF2914 domain-containing protein [Deltaproteobacteria bacterium]